MDQKVCMKCKESKATSEFSLDRAAKSGLRSYCKVCIRNSRGYEDTRRWVLNQYNLTTDDYALMMKKQNGVCAICGKPEITLSQLGNKRALAVDHCHKSGAIRGLLCYRCNVGIGYLNDDPTILARAQSYLA